MMRDEDRIAVYRCVVCGTAFEEGVADDGPNGEPRCPQCCLYDAVRIDEEPPPFVVRRTTKFR